MSKNLPVSTTLEELPITLTNLGTTCQDNLSNISSKSNKVLASSTNALEESFKRCSLEIKPSCNSETSYSVMHYKRKQQKQIFTTEHLLPTCQKCRSELEEGQEVQTNSNSRSRKMQRRSWPLYSHSISKKMSPPISPIKSGQLKSRKGSKSPASPCKDQELKVQIPIVSNSNATKPECKMPLKKLKRNLKRNYNKNRKNLQTGDTISFNPFPPIPITWRSSNRSLWDDSAAHLLDMTTSFLKKIPKVTVYSFYT